MVKIKYYILYLVLILSSSKIAFSIELISVISDSDTLFVGDKITIINNDFPNPIALYYSLDSGKIWKLAEKEVQEEYQLVLPFSLSRSIQFKAEKYSILPPEIIWDNRTAHTGEVRSIDISDDSKFAITLGRDNYIKVWDIDLRKCVDSMELGGTNYSYSAKFFHSNEKIIYSINDKSYLWDRKKKTNDVFYTLGDFIRSIDIHPKENRFAVVTNDNNIALFNESFLFPLPTFLRLYSAGDYSNFYTVQYSQNASRVGIGTYRGKIIISKGIFGESDDVFSVDNGLIFAIDFYNNDTKVVFGGSSNQAKILNLNDSSISSLNPIFKSQVRDIKYNPVRNDIVAVSLDSNLMQWDADKLKPISEGQIKEPYAILSLDITKSGDTLATCGRNNSFRIWKNYTKVYETNIQEFVYRQRLFADLKNDQPSFQPGSELNFSVNLTSKYSDTLSKLRIWDVDVQLSFPMNAIVFENEKRFSYKNGHILVDTMLNYDFKPDRLFDMRCKALFANAQSNLFKINEINVIPEDNFYIIKEDFEIDQEYVCGNIAYPSISLSTKPTFYLYNQIVDKSIELEIKVYVVSNFNIQLFDLLGERVADYIISGMKPGKHKIIIDTEMLKEGVYLLKVSNDIGFIFSEKILVE